MNVSKKIFLRLGPKFIGIVIAVLLALILILGIYQVFLKPSDNDNKLPSSGLTENEDEENGNTDNIDSDNPPTPEQPTAPVYSLNNAVTVTTPLSSQAAVLCNNSENTVILRKSESSPLPSAPVLGLATALAVMNSIESGEISPSDRAVCPASAIRLPCYEKNSGILSVGQSLTVAEMVKTMLCAESPELFAYTLAVHICGNEQAFVNRLNTLLKNIGTTATVFTTVSDSAKQTSTALDAAIIFRATTENSTLLTLLSSRESFTVSAGGNAWSTVTLCGRFYSECCTEGQAKADGIICGYYGEYDGNQYVFMLFEQLGIKYLTAAINSATAYADSLILLSNATR